MTRASLLVMRPSLVVMRLSLFVMRSSLLGVLASLLGVLACASCGDSGPLASAPLAMQTQALTIDQVKAVEVLVFDGKAATCTRVLELPAPLDDPSLDVEGHALFEIDGTPKYLANLPANASLAFYAEGYAADTTPRTIIGRGCTDAKIKAGSSTPITLTLVGTSP